MPDVTELTPGQVLADAEIAEFIKAMGLGIAEAQRALDENSVNQIPIFTQAQPGLGGRSLLDLGLSPAFYHFQSADMSVSLNISLRIQKNTGFDLGLNFGLNDAKTTTSANSDTKTETSSGTTSDTQHREARLNVKVTTDGALKVGGTDFQLAGDNPLARIRNLGTQLRSTESTGVKPRFLVEFGDGQKYSLLEPGFTPTFYQFVDTVIELKLSISMKTETASERKSSTTQVTAGGFAFPFVAGASPQAASASRSISARSRTPPCAARWPISRPTAINSPIASSSSNRSNAKCRRCAARPMRSKSRTPHWPATTPISRPRSRATPSISTPRTASWQPCGRASRKAVRRRSSVTGSSRYPTL